MKKVGEIHTKKMIRIQKFINLYQIRLADNNLQHDSICHTNLFRNSSIFKFSSNLLMSESDSAGRPNFFNSLISISVDLLPLGVCSHRRVVSKCIFSSIKKSSIPSILCKIIRSNWSVCSLELRCEFFSPTKVCVKVPLVFSRDESSGVEFVDKTFSKNALWLAELCLLPNRSGFLRTRLANDAFLFGSAL